MLAVMASFPGAEIVGVRNIAQPEVAAPADETTGSDDDED